MEPDRLKVTAFVQVDNSPECQLVMRTLPKWMLAPTDTKQPRHLLGLCFSNCTPGNSSGSTTEKQGTGEGGKDGMSGQGVGAENEN